MKSFLFATPSMPALGAHLTIYPMDNEGSCSGGKADRTWS